MPKETFIQFWQLYPTLLDPNEMGSPALRYRVGIAPRIDANGELRSAGLSAQIGFRIIIEDEWLFMYSFEALVRIAIFVVNGNDNTSPERPAQFRFGDSRGADRPIAATDSSREIPKHPDEELDVFDPQSHDLS